MEEDNVTTHEKYTAYERFSRMAKRKLRKNQTNARIYFETSLPYNNKAYFTHQSVLLV